MIDKSDTTNAYGAAAALPSSQVPGVNSQPTLDEGPAWKSAFHQTLVEIQDKGFRSYTDEIQAKKMEELREKILEAMCFNEDDLDNMPSSQREQIEKMVASKSRNGFLLKTRSSRMLPKVLSCQVILRHSFAPRQTVLGRVLSSYRNSKTYLSQKMKLGNFCQVFGIFYHFLHSDALNNSKPCRGPMVP